MDQQTHSFCKHMKCDSISFRIMERSQKLTRKWENNQKVLPNSYGCMSICIWHARHFWGVEKTVLGKERKKMEDVCVTGNFQTNCIEQRVERYFYTEHNVCIKSKSIIKLSVFADATEGFRFAATKKKTIIERRRTNFDLPSVIFF